MRRAIASQARFVAALVVLMLVGVASAVYVLAHQRAPNPFQKTYTVRVALSAADGVAPGLGQPVLVSGVHVGTITGAHIEDGNALVTLTIRRSELPTVHTDASAVLEPITPLKDMQIDLAPGSRDQPRLPPDATIGIDRTSTPVPLSDLLSALDTDTRTFLTTLAGSLGTGTDGRGPDLRRALTTLGPTTRAAGEVSHALAADQQATERLVHNVAQITRAASQDDQLADVVAAGNQTLAAVAAQDGPLDAALQRLPGTLSNVSSTLDSTAEFADELTPTLHALQPAVQQLPGTLAQLRSFSGDANGLLSSHLRPLVRRIQPALEPTGRAVADLNAVGPQLTSTFQNLQYLTNELAYNPPGDDEGGLFWFSWFVHNWNSLFSTSDAHGGIGRAMVMVNCSQLSSTLSAGVVLKALLGVSQLCPSGS